MSSLRSGLDIGASVAMITVAGMLTWLMIRQPPQAGRSATTPSKRGTSAAAVPTEPVPVGQSPTIGRSDAKSVLIMFSDFECPFCAKFAKESLPSLIAKEVHEGTVRLVFKFLPLEQIHPHALQAASSAACSIQQGKFWEAHDLLFAAPKGLEAASRELARDLHLDSRTFAQCLGTSKDLIAADSSLAIRLAINATPTLMFGVDTPDGRAVKVARRENGAIPYQALAAIVAEVAKGNPR